MSSSLTGQTDNGIVVTVETIVIAQTVPVAACHGVNFELLSYSLPPPPSSAASSHLRETSNLMKSDIQ